jgi:hypothetical protein
MWDNRLQVIIVPGDAAADGEKKTIEDCPRPRALRKSKWADFGDMGT